MKNLKLVATVIVALIVTIPSAVAAVGGKMTPPFAEVAVSTTNSSIIVE